MQCYTEAVVYASTVPTGSVAQDREMSNALHCAGVWRIFANRPTSCGVTLDILLSVLSHIAATCRSYFYQMHQIRSIGRSLSEGQVIMTASPGFLQHSTVFQCTREICLRLWMMAWKCLNGTAPGFLCELCGPIASASVHQHLWSASTGLLQDPRGQTMIGQRSVTIAGPSLWDSLPVALPRPEMTLPTFKWQLKACLFHMSMSVSIVDLYSAYREAPNALCTLVEREKKSFMSRRKLSTGLVGSRI